MYGKRSVLTALGSLLGVSAFAFSMAYAQATDSQCPVIVAHRGASSFAPEDTLAALHLRR
jgi:glycerophosphoryl diester phosphodiesterase